MPPPANVLADALVRLIVPVPVTVRLVDVAVFHPPVPAIVQVPEPMASVLVVEPEEATLDALPDSVTLYPFASKVPVVTLMVPAVVLEQLNASCNVNEPPGLFKSMPCVNVLPALVMVCDVRPANIGFPVPVSVVPVPLIQLP